MEKTYNYRREINVIIKIKEVGSYYEAKAYNIEGELISHIDYLFNTEKEALEAIKKTLYEE
jgi:hypothetical protein